MQSNRGDRLHPPILTRRGDVVLVSDSCQDDRRPQARPYRRRQPAAPPHFIHGRDIAQVVRHRVQQPPAEPGPRHYVLGKPALTANEAIAAIGRYTGRRSRLKIPLSIPLANVLIDLFRIQMAPWDRFCLRYRHFTYENPLHPAVLGLETRYPTLESVLADAGGTVSVEQPG